MIHVMHLVSTFQIKTDTKWLIRLLPKIDSGKFKISVGAFYDDGEARSAFDAMGFQTFCLNLPKVWDLRVVSHLKGKIREINPDLIHTHLLRADLFGGFAGKSCGKKVVSTVYACGDYRRAKRRKFFDGLLDKLSVRWADRFIGVSESIRSDLVERVGVADEKIRIIQTGMDMIELDDAVVLERRRGLGIADDEKVVLVGARLSYEKGVDCFLRAVGLLLERGVRARFLIAGDGPMAGELRELARELGIAGQVSFLGFALDMEILMACSDLVVMPSYSEGMPNVALETFSVGRPLVASSVGGFLDLSEMNPDSVLLAEPSNPRDLADKIDMVLSDDVLAERLRVGGRSIITETLSVSKVAGRYEEAYREIIG